MPSIAPSVGSATALLKSVTSVANTVNNYQDQVASSIWDRSAKTYQDFLSYQGYLSDRLGAATSPTKQLDYSNKIYNAGHTYVSAEIGRQSQAVMEGRSTNVEKYGVLKSFYQQALDNGDQNLAQSLNSRMDSLSITIQNEQIAAQNAAATLAMNGVKTLNKLTDLMTKGTDYVQLADGTVVKPLAMLDGELKASGNSSKDYFGEVLRTTQALQGVVASAYMGATTQDAVDAIETKYGDVLSGTKNFATAAGPLNMQEITLAYSSALANNPLYSPQASVDPTTGQEQFKLVKNQIDDFIWTRNADGTYQAMQTTAKNRDYNQSLDTKITNEGYILGDSGKSGVSNIGNGQQVKTDSADSIKNRLANIGIDASQNNDGTITITTQQGTFQGSIMPDGSVRYFGKPGQYSGSGAGLYEINIFNGNQREVAPDESSIFGTHSAFGGLLSQASGAGTNIIKELAGATTNTGSLFRSSDIISNLENYFGGSGVAAVSSNFQGSPSALIQEANQRVAAIQAKTVALQAQAAAPQNATALNLNQTPVQQFAQNGQPIRQLTVAPPAPTPNVVVGPPLSTPNISSVGVAQNVGKITSVGVAGPQPTLHF